MMSPNEVSEILRNSLRRKDQFLHGDYTSLSINVICIIIIIILKWTLLLIRLQGANQLTN